jgi:hypothetical protein
MSNANEFTELNGLVHARLHDRFISWILWRKPLNGGFFFIWAKNVILIYVSNVIRMSKICEFIGNCRSLVEVQFLFIYLLSHLISFLIQKQLCRCIGKLNHKWNDSISLLDEVMLIDVFLRGAGWFLIKFSVRIARDIQ